MTYEENDLVEALKPILREATDRHFRPGFTDRVMERIRADSEAPVIRLANSLRGQFFRLAPLAAAVLIALSAYNLIGARSSSGQSLLEAALGLEPVTLETAYAFEQVYYSTDGE